MMSILVFSDRHHIMSTALIVGEHGGLVVEPLTPEQEVGVRYLPPPCCVLEQRHVLPEKYW